MDHYKLINWDSAPIEEILSIITIQNKDREQVVPINKETEQKILELLKVDVSKIDRRRIMLVYFPPNKAINIHSDKPKETTDPGKLHRCIFLPLKNCENLIWSWFEPTDPSKIFYYGESENWQTVPMIHYKYVKEIESVICDKPFLSDIGTFHALRNTSNNPAIGISIRLMPWAWETIDTDTVLTPIDAITLR